MNSLRMRGGIFRHGVGMPANIGQGGERGRSPEGTGMTGKGRRGRGKEGQGRRRGFPSGRKEPKGLGPPMASTKAGALKDGSRGAGFRRGGKARGHEERQRT